MGSKVDEAALACIVLRDMMVHARGMLTTQLKLSEDAPSVAATDKCVALLDAGAMRDVIATRIKLVLQSLPDGVCQAPKRKSSAWRAKVIASESKMQENIMYVLGALEQVRAVDLVAPLKPILQPEPQFRELIAELAKFLDRLCRCFADTWSKVGATKYIAFTRVGT